MTGARFSQAGLETTRLGFGCASLMRLTTARERDALLGTAFAADIRHFDVARLYGLGQAEAELGRFARARRDQLTIATKFGIEPASGLGALARFQAPARALLNRYPRLRAAVKKRDEAFHEPRRYDAAIARRSLDKSLTELGLDYVDVLFVHDPAPGDHVHTEELSAFFEDVKAAGKIRAWGVSQDAHPGMELVGRLGPSALLQVREDALARASRPDPVLSFGVLGAAHARITRALHGDAALRRRWTEQLGDDPLSGNLLATLLIADALAANPEGVILYSTTDAGRIAVAAGALASPPAQSVRQAFTDLVAQDRAALQN